MFALKIDVLVKRPGDPASSVRTCPLSSLNNAKRHGCPVLSNMDAGTRYMALLCV